jgi:hypothetical protein
MNVIEPNQEDLLASLDKMRVQISKLDEDKKVLLLKELFKHAKLSPELAPKLKNLPAKQKEANIKQIIDSFID